MLYVFMFHAWDMPISQLQFENIMMIQRYMSLIMQSNISDQAIHENAFGNVVCEMTAILPGVNGLINRGTI